jgi:D-amino peptidase
VRVHIISDMEGVAGIVKWEQVSGGEKLYDECRVLYTEEINAAVRGAKDAGATEIVVMDNHGAGGPYDFNSLLPDVLDPDCEFVVQQEWTEYTGFLESGCDAALLVGMHAMAGTADGVLSHTVSGQAWQSLRFNGALVGETGINAAVCGNWACRSCS